MCLNGQENLTQFSHPTRQKQANTWRGRMPKLPIALSRLFLVLVGSAIVLAAVWGADLAGLATGLGVSSIAIGSPANPPA